MTFIWSPLRILYAKLFLCYLFLGWRRKSNQSVWKVQPLQGRYDTRAIHFWTHCLVLASEDEGSVRCCAKMALYVSVHRGMNECCVTLSSGVLFWKVGYILPPWKILFFSQQTTARKPFKSRQFPNNSVSKIMAFLFNIDLYDPTWYLTWKLLLVLFWQPTDADHLTIVTDNFLSTFDNLCRRMLQTRHHSDTRCKWHRLSLA